ncbi:MAG: hypothetical protein NC819_01545 [Candidatus Omnitrophica bacterium]|nr:hypothetical protein [Candidatus Omnitrophota bacterium]
MNNEQQTMRLLFLLWLILPGIIIYVRSKRGVLGVGVVVAFLLQLWTYHGISILPYILPWEFNSLWGTSDSSYLVSLGFQASTVALISFFLGTSIVGPFIFHAVADRLPQTHSAAPPRLPYIYIAVGFLSYFTLIYILKGAATLTAAAAAGWKLSTVGFCLLYLKNWRERKLLTFAFWVFVSCVGIPYMTIILQGFLAYGASVVLTLFTFIASFIRQRWRIFAVGILIGYLGLSFFVTYMRDRLDIRETISAGATLTERVETVSSTLNFEFFDVRNESHLQALDLRLNQNFFVGSGIHYIRSGFAQYARGETLWWAVLSLIPRAIWPSKEIVGGSMDMVETYTGLPLAEGTSFGVGPVMELYINFGIAGVFFGFLILSLLVAFLDFAAGRALAAGDWKLFCIWFLPGISIVEVGWSFVEVFSSTMTALLVSYLLNRFVLNKMRVEKPDAYEAPTSPKA